MGNRTVCIDSSIKNKLYSEFSLIEKKNKIRIKLIHPVNWSGYVHLIDKFHF